jgi:hypothetical protein
MCSALLRKALLSCVFGIPAFSLAQAWVPGPTTELFNGQQNPVLRGVAEYTSFRVFESSIAATLANAPLAIAGGDDPEGIVLALPQRNGNIKHYRIVEWDFVSPEIRAQIGEQKVYRGVGIDDPSEEVYLDYSRRGLKAMIRGTKGTTFVESMNRFANGEYFVYSRQDSVRVGSWDCHVVDQTFAKNGLNELILPQPSAPSRALQSLYRFQLALNTTAEYTTFHGSEVLAAQASVTTMVRVNGVYRTDLGIEMELIYLKNWTDPNTDPFTNGNGSTMLGQNHNDLIATIGSAAFDIGHVFSTGGGGVASLASVGISNRKGQGVTGQPNPVGDPFDIDYVAHEMGHQFGGNHTFNGITEKCGNNTRVSARAYEPGSGTTIMAYAGICGVENVQPNSDPFFHAESLREILVVRNDLTRGQQVLATSNNIPTVTSSGNFSIPQQTPFRLTSTATDLDLNNLTFCWEQYDASGSPSSTHGGPTTLTSTNTQRALFRSRIPTTSGTRYFPAPSLILANNDTNPFEFLPNVNRNMRFRCTVRDNVTPAGGFATDERTVTVSGAPFVVTAPASGVSWTSGSTQTVTWNVGGSAILSPNVNLRISYDGGNSYFSGGSSLLLANTPNDGTQTISVPNIATSTARIFVEATSGDFFDVNPGNISIALAQRPVSGIVIFQGLIPAPTGRPVGVQILNPGGATALQSLSTTASATGTFSVSTTLALGTYDIRITSPRFLSKKLANRNLLGSGLALGSVTLLAGDLDEDNEVGPGDFEVLVSLFGTQSTLADIDGDGEVGPADFELVVQNFGLQGE